MPGPEHKFTPEDVETILSLCDTVIPAVSVSDLIARVPGIDKEVDPATLAAFAAETPSKNAKYVEEVNDLLPTVLSPEKLAELKQVVWLLRYVGMMMRHLLTWPGIRSACSSSRAASRRSTSSRPPIARRPCSAGRRRASLRSARSTTRSPRSVRGCTCVIRRSGTRRCSTGPRRHRCPPRGTTSSPSSSRPSSTASRGMPSSSARAAAAASSPSRWPRRA